MKMFLNDIRQILKKIFTNICKLYFKMFFKNIGKHTEIHQSLEFYDPIKISIGDNCVIKKNVTLKGRSVKEIGLFIGKGVSIRENSNIDSYMGYVRIDDYCALGHNCFIGGQGGVSIGKYTMIGGKTYIISSNHKFDKNDIPYMMQGENVAEIKIGNNVWIGANCVILPGVQIGDNCVVGAGSVVTRSFESNQVIAGNPALPIKTIK